MQKITPAPNAGQTVSPTTQTPNTTTSQQTAGTTSGVTQTAEPQAAYRAATIRPTTFKRDIPAAPTQTRKAAPPTRISIHQKPAESVAEENTSTVQTVLDTPFTAEALTTAWLEYAKTIPTEVVLVNTMQSCRPQLVDPKNFVVSVDSQIQVDHINEHFHELMSFLQNALKNNQFSMQLRINQPGEKEIIFSPKDVLMKMIEKNPDIKNLYDTFDLEIA